MDWLVNPLISWLRDSPFSTASWVDWADISLLTYLVYRSILILQGTRALQSLLGLGILAGVYVLSDEFGLTTLHWLLEHLFVYLVLALLILFQEDIRRALARAAAPLAMRSVSQGTDAPRREEIIQAVFAMGKRRIGALIVLRRAATLDTFDDGAHRLDAEITTEILQAIFHPSSPIHDGAVTIEHGRIRSSGVFLPIATSKKILKAYGTRHRAAIGLTERIDAVCLVVSEERGTVSMVIGGQVIPVADPQDLRERLQEAMELGKDELAMRSPTHA
ncbi:MAG: diadenylate cyclase CdaA [Deltaproteobacteria bacterium]|nr:diadenylate cyclase CdaA [Deltaproteobacteria bacterium]